MGSCLSSKAAVEPSGKDKDDGSDDGGGRPTGAPHSRAQGGGNAKNDSDGLTAEEKKKKEEEKKARRLSVVGGDYEVDADGAVVDPNADAAAAATAAVAAKKQDSGEATVVSSGDNSSKLTAKEKEARAAAQRRRLSMAPDQVGDYEDDHGHDDHDGAAAQQRHSEAIQKAEHVDEVEQAAPVVLPADVEKQAKKNAGMAVVAKSKKGFVPYNKKKVNQDRPVIAYGLAGDVGISLFGALDGHGEFGG
jgi:hypothetical protein